MAEVLSHSESSVCFCGMHGRMWRERRKESERHMETWLLLSFRAQEPPELCTTFLLKTPFLAVVSTSGSLAALVSAPDTSKGGFP